MRISLERLYSRDFKIKSTIEEINNNELSMSNDKPVDVSYNREHNVYVVIDGHHRVIEAYLAGKSSIEGIRNEHVPYTYDLERENNVKLMDVVREEESSNVFENGKDVPLVENHLNKLEKQKIKKEKQALLKSKINAKINESNSVVKEKKKRKISNKI